MIVAAHQPIFLPWPGFFHKAARSERLVLLDDVQFPRGPSWLTRNRLKNENGELWLTVPVVRKGRGLQRIRQVEIYNEIGWRKKHLCGIRQNYVHAPYFTEYVAGLEAIYEKRHSHLAEFTIELIRFLLDALSLPTRVVRQSELGVAGRGTELFIGICERLASDRFLALSPAQKHIDAGVLKEHGIEVVRAGFRPPVYPQLWGDFVCNLSTLDLLLNCGPKARDLVLGPSDAPD
ncbi:MAG TPA: WbqC family protein [Candidatus Eisenbacteria bacterium]